MGMTMTEAIEAEVTEVEQPAAVTEEQNTAPLEEGSESGTESTEAETTKPEPPPETEEQKRSKYQRRIDRKNAEIAAARTEARLYKERLEQFEGQRQAPQRDAAAPKLEQFENFEDFIAARVAFESEKVVDSRLTKAQQAEAQRKAEEAQHQTLTSWRDRVESAADKYPDFSEVVGESDAPISDSMRQAIIESDLGTDVAYYLAQHPDEAKQIANQSPIRQIAAIGRLEAKLSQPAARKTTTAPAPITPAGSKATVEKKPWDMSFDEFTKHRRSVIAKR